MRFNYFFPIIAAIAISSCTGTNSNNEAEAEADVTMSDTLLADKALPDSTGLNTTDNDARPNVTNSLAPSGKVISQLVPASWERTTYHCGDMNRDGIKDLALISVPTSKENILEREDGYRINMNKPIVAIYLGKEDGSLQLFAQDSDVIPADDKCMSVEDMMLEIKDNGTLHVRYQDFHSMGTSDINNFTYIYQYQKDGFYLIGEEESSFNRMSHNTETVSVNYMTLKRQYRTEVEEGAKPKDRWEDMESEPLKKLGN